MCRSRHRSGCSGWALPPSVCCVAAAEQRQPRTRSARARAGKPLPWRNALFCRTMARRDLEDVVHRLWLSLAALLLATPAFAQSTADKTELVIDLAADAATLDPQL